MGKWGKIIEKNRNLIADAIKKADRDAYLNRHLKFTVYICENGTCETFEDIAGGNSFPSDAHDGKMVGIYTACHQYFDIIETYDDSECVHTLMVDMGVDCEKEFRAYVDIEEDDDFNDYFTDFVEFADERYPEEIQALREELAEEASSEMDADYWIDEAKAY